MRLIIVKAAILAAAVASACLGGCSHSTNTDGTASDESVGTVGVALSTGGITINTVTWTITGNGLNRTGTVDVSHANSIQFVVGGIPAGNGYTIALTATSTDASATCTGSATFNVAAHATTSVNVHLRCPGGTKNGSVSVNGTLNVCPTIDAISANPSSVEVGSSVALTAAASDVDNAPAALTYAWSAPSGTFASATSANTTFTCTAPGVVTLTLVANDSDCTDTNTVAVTCTGAPVPDAGPIDAAPTPDAAPIDAAPTPDAAPIDAAPSVTTLSILSGKNAACLACAQTNGCVDTGVVCEASTGNATAGPAAGTARSQLCLDTLSCVMTANCAASGTGAPCYCGTAAGATCLGAGNANGVCKTQEERGLETTDPTTIATGFGNTVLGGGVANILVQCLNDSACTTCFQ